MEKKHVRFDDTPKVFVTSNPPPSVPLHSFPVIKTNEKQSAAAQRRSKERTLIIYILTFLPFLLLDSMSIVKFFHRRHRHDGLDAPYPIPGITIWIVWVVLMNSFRRVGSVTRLHIYSTHLELDTGSCFPSKPFTVTFDTIRDITTRGPSTMDATGYGRARDEVMDGHNMFAVQRRTFHVKYYEHMYSFVPGSAVVIRFHDRSAPVVIYTVGMSRRFKVLDEWGDGWENGWW